MRVSFGRLLSPVLLLLANCAPALSAAETDQAVAEHIAGPHWRELSRRAGIVFVGTVLNSGKHLEDVGRGKRPDWPIPAIELRFQVERAIAGVESSKVVTIHQWAGAWSSLRPLHPGDRVLLFLYPPSKLGLTSPVSGARGQILLNHSPVQARTMSGFPLDQLVRAIRGARGE